MESQGMWPPAQPTTSAQPREPGWWPRRSKKAKTLIIATGVFVGLAIIGSTLDGTNTSSPTAVQPKQEAQQQVQAPKKHVQPAQSKPSESAGQQNARESAESYLETGSFSRKGLIHQLKFEGYSQADAVYAVDAISPNWNEQAAKSAESYLETGSFSRSGLIHQLRYEGFTPAQAEYGVQKAEPSESAGKQNARESAESYLETGSFSRKGLIHQLKFEGYSQADAVYAVDAISPNWNEQAAKSAESYLETGSFSRSGLIHQLRFEGFTPAQAEYGVQKAYG